MAFDMPEVAGGLVAGDDRKMLSLDYDSIRHGVDNQVMLPR